MIGSSRNIFKLAQESFLNPKAHLSAEEQQQLRAVHRGHLGIPEEIMKAGAAQYASMCNNINNKVFSQY